MIRPGEKVPLDLVLRVVRGGVESAVALRDLLTRRTIVSVYMRNNTPACDRQNDDLVAHAAGFDRLGCNLVALSRDTCGSHRRYAAKKHIPYTLAGDPGDAFAHATDSLVEKSLYGRAYVGPARAAYVIDPDGTGVAVVPKIDPKAHAAQLLAVLAGL